MENDEHGKRRQITPAKEPVGVQSGRKEKCEYSGDPHRRKDRVNDENLLREVCRGRKDHITAIGLDVAHQLRKGPVIPDIPDDIRKENHKDECAAKPDPLLAKNIALLGQQKSDYDAESEHRNRVLFFQANARDNTKPEPVTWVVALDRQDRK